MNCKTIQQPLDTYMFDPMSQLARRLTMILFALALPVAATHQSIAAPGDLLRSVPNPDTAPSDTDYFGFAIGVATNSIIAGTYNDDFPGAVNAGSIFQFNPTTFSLIRKIPNPAPQAGAQFGKSIIGLGPNFAVATAFDDSPDVVHYFDGANGNLLRTITAPAGSAFGGFFDAVTLAKSQGRIFVQGFNNVMAFDPNSGSLALNIPSPGDDPYFGRSMAERGSEIVISGLRDIYRYDATSGQLLTTIPSPLNAQLRELTVTPAGHVFAAYTDGKAYLFDGASNSIIFTINDPTSDHTYCCNVAAVGNYLVLGNKGHNVNEGVAYLFNASTGALVRTINNPSGPSLGSGEYFGETIVPFNESFMIGVIQADIQTPASRDAGGIYLFDAASVPEPSSFFLIATSSAFWLTHRRRTQL
jgi:hypothetical protein